MKLEFNGEVFDFDDQSSLDDITHYLVGRKGQMDNDTVHSAVQQGAMMAATTAAMSNLFNTQNSNKEVIEKASQAVLSGLTDLVKQVEAVAQKEPVDHWDALQKELDAIKKAIPKETKVDFTGLAKAVADSQVDVSPILGGLQDIRTLLERVLKTPVAAPKKQRPIDLGGFEVVSRDGSGNTKRVKILTKSEV